VNKEQAIARAKMLHQSDPMLGEDVRGVTRRWVEHTDDRSRPGPVRDRLVWVVEFGGDSGATFDVYIDDVTGDLLREEGYS
jgi:hypothetical protein